MRLIWRFPDVFADAPAHHNTASSSLASLSSELERLLANLTIYPTPPMDYTPGHLSQRSRKRSLEASNETAGPTTMVELRGFPSCKRHRSKPPSVDLPSLADPSPPPEFPLFSPPTHPETQYQATPPLEPTTVEFFGNVGDEDMSDAPKMPPSPVSETGDNNAQTVPAVAGDRNGGSQRDVEMGMASQEKKANKFQPSFRMGYRDDCEKCRLHTPGHFGHLEGRWQVPGRS